MEAGWDKGLLADKMGPDCQSYTELTHANWSCCLLDIELIHMLDGVAASVLQ